MQPRLTAATPWARHTTRLDEMVHHLGLTLGGRPAASLAQRLQLPVSNDTLLRVVRRRGTPAFAPPQAIGIDDWAWKRNYRYGTLICDLERRCTIALLPDREPATAQAWLSSQPQIEIVTRDRGGAYALAAARALRGAVQVGALYEVRAYAERIELRQGGKIVGEHRRDFGRDQTVFDPWHYVPVLARKPGALRNGAPFKDWLLPSAMESIRRKLAGSADGDRQMVTILAASPLAGLV